MRLEQQRARWAARWWCCGPSSHGAVPSSWRSCTKGQSHQCFICAGLAQALAAEDEADAEGFHPSTAFCRGEAATLPPPAQLLPLLGPLVPALHRDCMSAPALRVP